MGLERITACLNGKKSNYDTDLFIPLFETIQKMSRKESYKGLFSASADCLDTNYRILADHSRMIAVALADGLLPHDSIDLRKAIRRSIQIGWDKFGLLSSKHFMGDLVEVVSQSLGGAFPELVTNLRRSKQLLDYEEEQARELRTQIAKDWPRLTEAFPNLSNLSNVTQKVIEGLKATLPNSPEWGPVFPIDEALKLHEKYYIPVETIEEISKSLGFALDLNQFNETLNKKQNTVFSKSSSTVSLKDIVTLLQNNGVSTTDNSFKYNYSYLPDKGYTYDEIRSSILGIVKGGALQTIVNVGDLAALILKSSNFYPKAGGQLSDKGSIELGHNVFKVNKVETLGSYVIHFGKVASGSFSAGDEVLLKISKGQRLAASRLHTLHHLFRAAIEAVTGMAYQRVSEVSEKNFVMDLFVHPPLRIKQIIEAENIVKEWINQNCEISRKTTSIFDALRTSNVTVVSGEKYPEDVHVISSHVDLPQNLHISQSDEGAEDSPVTRATSSELCCGTHLFNTGHIGNFALTDIRDQGYGVMRISAICGKEAAKLNANGDIIRKEFDAWKAKITTTIQENGRLRELNNEFRKWRTNLKRSQIPATVFHFIEEESNSLTEQMNQILLPESNWKELQREFREHLSLNPEGPIIYEMKADYRGPMENLDVVMNEASSRPAAFVCKGWGRVRVVIYIPQSLQTEKFSLEKILDEIQSVLKEGKIVRADLDNNEKGFYYVEGVKRDRIDDIKAKMLNVCYKWYNMAP